MVCWHTGAFHEGIESQFIPIPKRQLDLCQPNSCDNHFSLRITTLKKIMSNINFKTYICIVCGFVYDEAEGRTEDGIAPGTLWADVPEDWTCPDCGVAKADFEVVAI